VVGGGVSLKLNPLDYYQPYQLLPGWELKAG
jgi:hypothetical protein